MFMLKNEKGMAMVLVLFIVVLTTMLGTVVWHASSQETLSSRKNENKTQAYYFARSGVEMAISLIKNGYCDDMSPADPPVEFWGTLDGPLSPTETQDYNIKFIISLDIVDGEYYFNIDSVGIVREGQIYAAQAQSDLKYKIRKSDIVDNGSNAGGNGGVVGDPMALFAETSITINSDAKINGNVATNSITANSIKFSYNGYINNGNLYIGPGGDGASVVQFTGWQRGPETNIPNGSIENLPSVREYPLPSYQFDPFPSFLPLPEEPQTPVSVSAGGTIANDGWYNVNVNNGNLLINTGSAGEIRKVCVSSFNLNGGHIQVQGSGRLYLYISGNFSMKNSTINNNGDSTLVYIFLHSDIKSITLDHNIKIFGSLYAEDATIKLTGNSMVKGNIYTEGSVVELLGSNREAVSGSIFAENGNIKVYGDSIIRGNIYSAGDMVEVYGSVRDAVIGAIFIENGVVNIYGSATINGDVISRGGTVRVSGSGAAVNGFTYAPCSNVEVLNSGMIQGTVVANTCTVDGGNRDAITANSSLDTTFFNSLGWGTNGPPSLVLNEQVTPVVTPNTNWRNKGKWVKE
ncbi:Polymer-forming cytoskeletal [Sporotomaculum syntrophicum]|uniref:Polymer-forming cytoskeletal n=1 Tax=Sporotomaculum syntrophicum TaxID=182264 RepID=A0A9D2WTY1_9FIRM|nr:polymer-forming cytoskeletal protein [Sporotomaculum syntrophicum]KAF1086572.1 Polymer-forming cytoskeletal [Sporotomaculum syntrophicum]